MVDLTGVVESASWLYDELESAGLQGERLEGVMHIAAQFGAWRLVPHRRRRGPMDPEPRCRICGCTDWRACVDDDGETCFWVEQDLCSACIGTVEAIEDLGATDRSPLAIVAIGHGLAAAARYRVDDMELFEEMSRYGEE